MRIYGLDFTSAPSPRKPITCAAGIITDNRLQVDTLEFFGNFDAFVTFLRQPGPWLAGLDFPFGQPRQLIQDLGWPASWEGYVKKVSKLDKPDFVQLLTEYCDSQPAGKKHHLRTTDKKAGSCSPMMLYGVPVGKMFFEGAPRLLKAGVSVWPCRPTHDSRVCIEAYPKLVAKKCLQRSYKSDTRAKQTSEQQSARQDLLSFLRSQEIRASYGFSLQLSDTIAKDIVHDVSGDRLDAVLCAIQAAWAYRNNFAVPPECDPLEGWIFDPELVYNSC